VQAVLGELGAGDKPRIAVFSKIDRLDVARQGVPMPISERVAYVSATNGEGLAGLLQQIANVLREQMVAVDTLVPYTRGELVARARTSGDVKEHYLPGGVRISGNLPQAIASELASAGRRRGRGARSARS